MKKTKKNLRRIFIIFAFLTAILIPVASHADTSNVMPTDKAYSVSGGTIYYNNAGEITGATTSVTKVDIPLFIGGVQIEKIGIDAFYNCKLLEEIKLPSYIEVIEDYAFEDCKALKEVIVPSGVKTIGDEVFSGCTALEQLYIPKTVTGIGDDICYLSNKAIIYCHSSSFMYTSYLQSYAYPYILTDDISNLETTMKFFQEPKYIFINGIDPGEPFVWIPSLTIKNADKTTYSVSYKDNIYPGLATVTISGTGQYTGMVIKTFTIKKGDQELWSPCTGYDKIFGNKPFKIEMGVHENAPLAYNSSKPNVVSISSNGIATIKRTGFATITITAAETANYFSAKEEVTVLVMPKKMTVSKVTTPKKGQLKLSWKKDSSIDGYQILYSTSKNFNDYKLITIKKSSTTNKVIKKLKSKKTYYVKMCGYAKIGSWEAGGDWSKTKKIKVK